MGGIQDKDNRNSKYSINKKKMAPNLCFATLPKALKIIPPFGLLSSRKVN
jgi:hypothetical protein